jgi:hypothetical protein
MRIGPFEINRPIEERVARLAQSVATNGHKREPDRSDLTELGGSGGQRGGIIWHDYNPDLRGTRALDTYEQMRRGDGKVRQALRIVKTPILAANWYVEPASNSKLDKEVAEFVWWNFNNLNRTFVQLVTAALLCMDYGFYVHEKVYELATWRPENSTRGRERQVVKWKKFGPRPPRSIEQWLWDANGGVAGVRHRPLNKPTNTVDIPIEKLLIFTFEEQDGDPVGMPLLRSAYKHWYFADEFYKIDGVQKERHGVGVPEIILPMGASEADKKKAVEMARNIRTNEQAEIVAPFGWEIKFAKMEGQPVDVLKSAQWHASMITATVLAQFLDIGLSASGSRGTSDSHQQVFMKSLKVVVDFIGGVFSQYAIPQLVDFNFNVSAYPRLKARRVGDDTDARALSVALANLAAQGIITPDAPTEEFVRSILDMPAPADEVMKRGAKDRGQYAKQIQAEKQQKALTNTGPPGGDQPNADPSKPQRERPSTD